MPRRIWSDEEKRAVYQRIAEGASYAELMAEFNATQGQIMAKKQKFKRYGGEIKNKTWSEEENEAIFKRFDDGETVPSIAKDLNLPISLITGRYNLYIKRDRSRKKTKDRTNEILELTRKLAEDPSIDLSELTDMPHSYTRVIQVIAENFTLTERC